MTKQISIDIETDYSAHEIRSLVHDAEYIEVDSISAYDKLIKGYEFPNVTFDESAVLDTKKLRAAVTSMRSGKTWSAWDSLVYFKKFKIPAADFYQTVSPRELFRVLERAVFATEQPSPHLFLLYLEIKNANEKTKLDGFQNSI